MMNYVTAAAAISGAALYGNKHEICKRMILFFRRPVFEFKCFVSCSASGLRFRVS